VTLSFVLFIALAALLLWAVIKLRVYPAVGAGYCAKVLCTNLFGSRREFDAQVRTQIADDSYVILRPFRVQIDRDARTVTASLVGLSPRTAVQREGLGATLVPRRSPLFLPAGPLLKSSRADWDWPIASGSAGLQRLVDSTFSEPNPIRLRRTYAVVIVHDGRIVAERYAPGIRPDMPLPGWSMAKSVLNALVGVLVHDGRLALDQKALMPQWQSPDPRAMITLEDLLRMRSGLRFSEAYAKPWSDVLHMLYDCHDSAAYAASLPLTASPGTTWSYSSGTSNILSAIVRRTVGDADYFDFPRRALFNPLGMTSAILEPDGSGTFVCSSSMLATARDWARFGQLYVDGGRWNSQILLPEWWIEFSTTATSQSPDGRFGAHWWLKLNPEIGGDSQAARRIAPDAFFAIGHEGQTLTVIPSQRLVVVRLGASIYIDAWNQAEFIANIEDAL
jgi:CubicO group peptidase (beta-lactamase class C family)